MTATDDDRHLLLEQRTRRELGQRDELAHQRDLDLVGAERFRDRVRAPAANVDLDVGMRARETGECDRRDVQSEIGREPESEHAAASFTCGFRLGDTPAHRLERGLRTWQEAAPRRRQAHTPPSRRAAARQAPARDRAGAR